MNFYKTQIIPTLKKVLTMFIYPSIMDEFVLGSNSQFCRVEETCFFCRFANYVTGPSLCAAHTVGETLDGGMSHHDPTICRFHLCRASGCAPIDVHQTLIVRAHDYVTGRCAGPVLLGWVILTV